MRLHKEMKEEVITIEKYFNHHKNTLVVLSLFLIVAFQTIDFNLILTFVALAISYICFIAIIGSYSQRRTKSAHLIEYCLILFIGVFLFYVINKILAQYRCIGYIAFIVLMLYPIIRYVKTFKAVK